MKELMVENQIKRMTSLEIAELVESRHDKVKQSIERLAKSEIISLPPMGEVKVQRERREETVLVYHLDKRSSLIVVAQLSPEFTARVVDRWQELESQQYKLPDFTNPAAAAIAWAEQYTRATIAEQTKAQIGHKREATAMNTASQLAKKNRKLEGLLDHLKEYVSLKRMEMIFHGQRFNWRELKSLSILMEKPPIDVFDANYGTVKAYHRDVWRELYAIDAEGNTFVAPEETAHADVN